MILSFCWKTFDSVYTRVPGARELTMN